MAAIAALLFAAGLKIALTAKTASSLKRLGEAGVEVIYDWQNASLFHKIIGDFVGHEYGSSPAGVMFTGADAAAVFREHVGVLRSVRSVRVDAAVVTDALVDSLFKLPSLERLTFVNCEFANSRLQNGAPHENLWYVKLESCRGSELFFQASLSRAPIVELWVIGESVDPAIVEGARSTTVKNLLLYDSILSRQPARDIGTRYPQLHMLHFGRIEISEEERKEWEAVTGIDLI